jgi:hypothetical protein
MASPPLSGWAFTTDHTFARILTHKTLNILQMLDLCIWL